MNENIVQIKSILNQMRDIFRDARGPRRRRDYMRAVGVRDADWIYRLGALDVIEQHIPARVAGPFARAKLFCKLASQIGLSCAVVITANADDLAMVHDGADIFINGFPLIAVNIDGVLRAFNPAHSPLVFVPGTVAVGQTIRSVRHWMPCPICAIVPCDEFVQIDSWAKMRELYLGDGIIS